MTKSCIKVWVSKVKGDYERHLTLAKNKLWMQLDSVFEQQMSEFLYNYYTSGREINNSWKAPEDSN